MPCVIASVYWGANPTRKLRDLYARAAVVVVPLLDVDHPSGITALFEGMAMGRSVIASDVGSSRSVVQDGSNGLLVPVGDPVRLRAAITRLIDDAALRARLGQAARRSIETEYSYAAYVRRFADSLKATLAHDAGLATNPH